MFSFNLHASTSILRKENVSHTVGEKTNYTWVIKMVWNILDEEDYTASMELGKIF